MNANVWHGNWKLDWLLSENEEKERKNDFREIANGQYNANRTPTGWMGSFYISEYCCVEQA
jgi:hypothetical protein